MSHYFVIVSLKVFLHKSASLDRVAPRNKRRPHVYQQPARLLTAVDRSCGVQGAGVSTATTATYIKTFSVFGLTLPLQPRDRDAPRHSRSSRHRELTELQTSFFFIVRFLSLLVVSTFGLRAHAMRFSMSN